MIDRTSGILRETLGAVGVKIRLKWFIILLWVNTALLSFFYQLIDSLEKWREGRGLSPTRFYGSFLSTERKSHGYHVR
jgi:hypothetical protein